MFFFFFLNITDPIICKSGFKIHKKQHMKCLVLRVLHMFVPMQSLYRMTSSDLIMLQVVHIF